MINDMQTQTPGPGHGQWLVFECGSMIPYIMLRASSRLNAGSQYRRKQCQKCHAKLINKIIYCVDCHKYFLVSDNAPPQRIRCKACANAHKKVLAQNRWKNRDKNLPVREYTYKELKKTPGVKPDCKFYLSDCLPKAAFKPRGQGKIYCNDCIYYEQEVMHAKIATKDCEGHIYNLAT